MVDRRTFCKIGLASMAALGADLSLTSGCSKKRKNLPAGNDPPNFIIFLVDKLRPDHLGVYGYGKNTSPQIDLLAKEGMVFDHAYAPSPWTLPSVMSLLSGLLPLEHAVAMQKGRIGFLRPGNWMTSIFKKLGYATVCFFTHPFFRRKASNILDAFDESHDPSEIGRKGKRFSDFMYLDTLFPALERWLEANHQKRFFLYVHVIDVHGPYNRERVLVEDEELFRFLKNKNHAFPRMRNGMYASSTSFPYAHKSIFYDGHIRCVDDYFSRLVHKVGQLGIGGKTLVVLTSDHGDGFGEHGCWHHGRSVFENQIRIPLIFYSHRQIRENSGRVKGIVNTLDLLPTMLAMVGQYPGSLRKRAFMPLISKHPAARSAFSVSDGCLEREISDPDAYMEDTNFKLISDKRSGQQFLYDLKADPAEMRPTTPGKHDSRFLKEMLGNLAGKREMILKSLEKRRTQSHSLETEEVEDLKTLGYL
jgi:arylsulfatase A-like enzyme